MSDIDLIRHYRLGVFSGIPVYMCREDGCWRGRPSASEPSHVAREKAICIGGGSGEHPALVINEPANCVAIYLRYAGVSDSEINERAKARTSGYMIYCDGMTKAQWEETLKEDYVVWRKDLTFERWIAATIGEFIYFMLPHEYPSVTSWRAVAEDVWPYFQGILIPWDQYSGNGTDYFEVTKRN